jgi:1-acyl-sn-glycerol-3-phosphate acyltransferase
VTDGAPSRLDLAAVQRFWAQRFGLEGWPVEDLCFGLARRFVADVRLEDPAAFQAVAGQSVLYLGNHQTGIESILFSVLISALAGTTTMTLAKAEHRDTWLGRMLRHWFSYPGAHDPGVIAHFDRKEAASLLTILEDLSRAMRTEHKSLLVHVEGTRALGCRTPVASMSGTFVDLALALGAAVVPVRFSGGLPVVPAAERLEFPVGMGQQTYHVGAPILPTELATLSYKARIDRIVGAINALGGPASDEVPHAPDPAFSATVERIVAEGIAPPHAVLRAVLAECPTPSAVTQKILARDLDGLGPERAFAAELSALLFPAR